MGFDSGAIAFTRFNVVGKDVPHLPDEAMLEKFAALALKVNEETTSEVDYGWTGGRHVYDANFSVGNCVYNDCIHIGFRVDTNRVPTEIKKAYIAMEESAAAEKNPSGFASKKQKKDAKESAGRQIDADLASGKYRRMKLTNVLWDVPNGVVYAAVSMSTREQLQELFERTFGLTLEPITAGNLAMHRLETFGMRRHYEDIVPTRFAASDMQAEYPWTAKGDTAKDFIGNEFMMWLWHEAGTRGGEVMIDANNALTVMFSKTLDLDCSFGTSGKTSLKLEVPTEMAEAFDALRSGKVPRKTGLTIALHGQLFTLSFGGEMLSFSGLKLPEIEKADSARVLFEERITLLRDFLQGFDKCYDTFLKLRASESWNGYVDGVRRWMASKTRAAAPVAASAA